MADVIGDQHLLAEAPVYALHRLRKAELVRLWKVAGMWSTDDEDGDFSSATSVEDDDDGGLSKKELIDGLIAAVRPSVVCITSLTYAAAEISKSAQLCFTFTS